MDRQAEVLRQLSSIQDPDLGQDIVTLGFIKHLLISDNGKVSFTIELTTPACPVKEQFRQTAELAVRELPWVTGVLVTMGAQGKKKPAAGAAASPKVESGLVGVKHILAVASCKGGVGKSTVAVNLAFTLRAMGAKVGIFDADVYGPSLPTMVKVKDFDGLFQQGGQILPVMYEDVKCMSFGYAAGPEGGPAIMRGPMVTNVINQLLTGTQWGDLDYLVLDLPPGTGDIQLTLTQAIPITAAIMVTTPQTISFVDVVKGLQMFDKMKVPTIAVVENMNVFICDGCNKEHHIFGQGAMQRLVNQFGLKNSFGIPMVAAISKYSDAGTPIVTVEPDGAVAKRYRELGDAVVREVAKVVAGGVTKPEIEFHPLEGIRVTPVGGAPKTIKAKALRCACRCAHCINEWTGEPQLDPDSVSEEIAVKDLKPMGNYAISIAWSDGHGSIYPYEQLIKL